MNTDVLLFCHASCDGSHLKTWLIFNSLPVIDMYLYTIRQLILEWWQHIKNVCLYLIFTRVLPHCSSKRGTSTSSFETFLSVWHKCKQTLQNSCLMFSFKLYEKIILSKTFFFLKHKKQNKTKLTSKRVLFDCFLFVRVTYHITPLNTSAPGHFRK